MQMVDRKLLVEDWQQVETVLTEMEKDFGTPELNHYWWEIHSPRLIKGLYRAVWHILEYLIRRDKA